MNENVKMNKTDYPSFSVVVPCYNVENYVEEALESIFNFQYEGNVQIIIVDDGSTDNTWERVQSFVNQQGNGRNICLVQHECNKGVSAATDTAYQYAIYDWLVKADADDIQMPNRLAVYAELIKKYPQVCAIALACQRIREDYVPYEYIPYAYSENNVSTYILNTPIQRYESRMGLGDEPQFSDLGGTVAISRELYLKWGNLVVEGNSGERFSDDSVWAVRYMLSGSVVGSNVVSCLYRTRISGNLEYRSQGHSYKSLLLHELNSVVSSLAKAKASTRSMQCCLQALEQKQLSDWSKEHILEYAERLKKIALYFETRVEWWNWSCVKRCIWYLKNRKKLLPVHRGWCFNRLLPLRISILFRYIILKIR